MSEQNKYYIVIIIIKRLRWANEVVSQIILIVAGQTTGNQTDIADEGLDTNILQLQKAIIYAVCS